jgi:hypothetical protein
MKKAHSDSKTPPAMRQGAAKVASIDALRLVFEEQALLLQREDSDHCLIGNICGMYLTYICGMYFKIPIIASWVTYVVCILWIIWIRRPM